MQHLRNIHSNGKVTIVSTGMDIWLRVRTDGRSEDAVVRNQLGISSGPVA